MAPERAGSGSLVPPPGWFSPEERRRERRLDLLIGLLATLLALVVRLHDLGRHPFWIDEFLTWQLVRPGLDFWEQVRDVYQGPLFHALVWPLARLEPGTTVRVGAGTYHQYTRIDPRASLQFQLDSTARIDLSAGRYHQYLQLISNAESPFNSFEVWLPAGPNIRPQSARQVSVSFLKDFRRAGLEFSLAAYYKQMEQQIDYQPHAEILLNPLVAGALRFGSMRSYGAEVMLKKETGRLNGWLAYTYARALRQTPTLHGGREYPAFQDRPHDLSLSLNYRLSDRWSLSAYYTAYTGSPFSSPTGFYTFNDQTVPLEAEKNNDRLPDYRPLDIALRFRLNKNLDQRFQHSLTFSLYNALGHQNVVSVNFNKIPVAGARPVVKSNLLSDVPLSPTQIDLIRFFPSLTYKFGI